MLPEFTHEDMPSLPQVPALTLAYIGDGVYELGVRCYLLKKGYVKPDILHKVAVGYVNANFQSGFYYDIESRLNDDELAALKRGRNSKSAHQPKSCSVQDYRNATGIEALFGYVYLKGNQQRLQELFGYLEQYIQKQEGEDSNG